MNTIILSALLGVVMMISGIFTSNKNTLKNIALFGFLGLFFANIANTYGIFNIDVDTKGMLEFSRYGLFFNSILIASTLLYVFLCGDDIVAVGENAAEYFALIFFIICGASILTSFTTLLMLFLGVEILTIPLYILAGADKRNFKSNEASLKYFLMGAFSTGIMLMGITLMYGATGTFTLNPVVSTVGKPLIILPIGLLFIFISMAFKVSAAPFHFWTPDVYDGSPTVFTGFMATVVKAAGFFAFIKVFESNQAYLGLSWKIILPIIIIATLLLGNLTAVFQQSVKRMLAYSSIAQAGFMLFALYSNNTISKEGLILYATGYSIASIGIFAILIKMKDYTFEGYNGLSQKQPILAFANTVFLLSLAGIPLTAGFFAKYYMLVSAVQTSQSFFLVIVAVLFAAISVYYYFKVIQAMYFKSGDAETTSISSTFKFTILGMCILIIILGIYPNMLLQFLYF